MSMAHAWFLAGAMKAGSSEANHAAADGAAEINRKYINGENDKITGKPISGKEQNAAGKMRAGFRIAEFVKPIIQVIKKIDEGN